jgi:hypothetical protein
MSLNCPLGHRTQDTGHKTQYTGHRTQDTVHRTQDTGHRTKTNNTQTTTQESKNMDNTDPTNQSGEPWFPRKSSSSCLRNNSRMPGSMLIFLCPLSCVLCPVSFVLCPVSCVLCQISSHVICKKQQFSVLCFFLSVFLLCLLHLTLSVSVDCPFLIDPSVVSNVYLHVFEFMIVIVW